MSIGIGAIGNFPFPPGYAGPGSASAPGAGAGASDFQKVLEEFRNVAFQTPAERARDEVLKRNGLDERSYAELSTERRQAIDQQVAEAVQAVTRVRTEKDGARFA